MTTTTLCTLCLKQSKPERECWISYDLMPVHMEAEHGAEIEAKALYTIHRTKDQVSYCYEHYPATVANNGALIERMLMLFPYRNAKVFYNPANKRITLEADFADMMYIFKHMETITRLGRSYRAKKQQPLMTSKAAERSVQADWSKRYWSDEGKR